MEKLKLLVTDGDGTGWSFWDYFVPAVRAMLPVIAKETGLSEDIVARQIGTAMSLYGTHEYPWALELTDFARKYGNASRFRDNISVPFWEALDSYRLRYLKLFPDVMETMLKLKSTGVHIVLLSDAPLHMALTRTRQLELDRVIDEVYALRTDEPGAGVLSKSRLAFGRERVSNFFAAAAGHRFAGVHQLSPRYEKPHARGLSTIMRRYGVTPAQTLFIGDSLPKDGGVAMRMGVRYIWAAYGTVLSAEYAEMINTRLKPLVAIKPKHATTVTPPFVAAAHSYAEVLNHLHAGRAA